MAAWVRPKLLRVFCEEANEGSDFVGAKEEPINATYDLLPVGVVGELRGSRH